MSDSNPGAIAKKKERPSATGGCRTYAVYKAGVGDPYGESTPEMGITYGESMPAAVPRTGCPWPGTGSTYLVNSNRAHHPHVPRLESTTAVQRRLHPNEPGQRYRGGRGRRRTAARSAAPAPRTRRAFWETRVPRRGWSRTTCRTRSRRAPEAYPSARSYPGSPPEAPLWGGLRDGVSSRGRAERRA